MSSRLENGTYLASTFIFVSYLAPQPSCPSHINPWLVLPDQQNCPSRLLTNKTLERRVKLVESMQTETWQKPMAANTNACAQETEVNTHKQFMTSDRSFSLPQRLQSAPCNFVVKKVLQAVYSEDDQPQQRLRPAASANYYLASKPTQHCTLKLICVQLPIHPNDSEGHCHRPCQCRQTRYQPHWD